MTGSIIIKLQDGNVMPQPSLGVWKASNEEVVTAVHKALEVGYRSIDTAATCKNGEGVDKTIRGADVLRDELLAATKLWNDDQEHLREVLLESMEKLQLDYPDLYLVHWSVLVTDRYVEARENAIDL